MIIIEFFVFLFFFLIRRTTSDGCTLDPIPDCSCSGDDCGIIFLKLVYPFQIGANKYVGYSASQAYLGECVTNSGSCYTNIDNLHRRDCGWHHYTVPSSCSGHCCMADSCTLSPGFPADVHWFLGMQEDGNDALGCEAMAKFCCNLYSSITGNLIVMSAKYNFCGYETDEADCATHSHTQWTSIGGAFTHEKPFNGYAHCNTNGFFSSSSCDKGCPTVAECVWINLWGLPLLTSIGMSLDLDGLPDMQNVSLPSLQSVGYNIIFNDLSKLAHLSYPSLFNVGGDFIVSNCIPTNPTGDTDSLTEINLHPSLIIGGWFKIIDMPMLGWCLFGEAPCSSSISFSQVGGLQIANRTNFNSLSFPYLTQVNTNGISITGTYKPSFVNAECDGIGDTCNVGLKELSFPSLTIVHGDIIITENDELETISFPNLISVVGKILIAENPVLINIDMRNLTSVAGPITFSFYTSMTTINLDISSLQYANTDGLGNGGLFYLNAGWTSLPHTSLLNIDGPLVIYNHPNLIDVDGINFASFRSINTSLTPELQWLVGLCKSCNDPLLPYCANDLGDMPKASQSGILSMFSGKISITKDWDEAWDFSYCTICTSCVEPNYKYCNNRLNEASRTCEPCPAGSYCRWKIQTSPVPCDTGYYSDIGWEQCNGPCPTSYSCPSGILTPCPPGSWQDEVGQLTCKPCAPGYYCNNDYMIECDAGSFSTGTSSSSCTPCTSGYYQPASGQDNCLWCEPGHQCSNPTEMVACVPGTYQVSWGIFESNLFHNVLLGQIFCNEAQPGYYSDDTIAVQKMCIAGTFANATKLITCYDCEPGHYCSCTDVPGKGCSDQTECVEGTAFAGWNRDVSGCPVCDDGDYANVTGMSVCLECPAGSSCLNKDETPLICITGFWSSAGAMVCDACDKGHQCADRIHEIPCSPGTFAAYVAQTHCDVCENGTFADTMASTFCEECDRGYQCPNSSLPQESCLEGWYSYVNKTQYCLECDTGYRCPYKDLYQIACIPGTFSDSPGLTFCTNCSKLGEGLRSGFAASSCYNCSAGFFCPNTSSPEIPCPEGTHSAMGGATACIECPIGYMCPNATEYPTSCPPGSYMPHLMYTFCFDCDNGTFAYESNSTVCSDCPRGYYCPSTALPPIPCENGTYTHEELKTVCYNCTAGSECPTQTDEPIPCLPGTYSQDRWTACQNCLSGEYTSSILTTICTSCDPGTYASSPGASSCDDCESGYYASDYGSVSCTECLQGWYCNATHQVELCPPGTFSTAGQSVCTDCAIGTYQILPGRTKCDDCPTRFYCPNATATGNPYPCPPGSANPNTNQPRCPLCMAGAYQTASESEECLYCQYTSGMLPSFSGRVIGATDLSECNHQNLIDADIPVTLSLGDQEVEAEDQNFGSVINPILRAASEQYLEYIITIPVAFRVNDVRIKVTLLQFAIESSAGCSIAFLNFPNMNPPLKICGGLLGEQVIFSNNTNVTDFNALELYTTTESFNVQFYAKHTPYYFSDTFKGFTAHWEWDYPHPMFDPSKMETDKQIGVYHASQNKTEYNNVEIYIPLTAFYNPPWAINLLHTSLNFTAIDSNTEFDPMICEGGTCFLEPPSTSHPSSYLLLGNATFLHLSENYVINIIVTNIYGLSVSVPYILRIRLVAIPSSKSYWNCTNLVPELETALTCANPLEEHIGLYWPVSWVNPVTVLCNVTALDDEEGQILTFVDNFLPLHVDNLVPDLSTQIPFHELVGTDTLSIKFNWNFHFARAGGVFQLGNGVSPNMVKVILTSEPDDSSEITCNGTAQAIVNPGAEVQCTIVTKHRYQKVYTCWGFPINGTSDLPYVGSQPFGAITTFNKPPTTTAGTSFSVLVTVDTISGPYVIRIADTEGVSAQTSATIIVVSSPDITSLFTCQYPIISQGRSILCEVEPRSSNINIWAKSNHFTFEFDDPASFTTISFSESASNLFEFSLETTSTATVGTKIITLKVDGISSVSVFVDIIEAPFNSILETSDLARFYPIGANITVYISVRNQTNGIMDALAHAFSPSVQGGGTIVTDEEWGVQLLGYNWTSEDCPDCYVGDPMLMTSKFRFKIIAPSTSAFIEVSDGVAQEILGLHILDYPDNTSYILCNTSWQYVGYEIKCTFYPQRESSSIYMNYGAELSFGTEPQSPPIGLVREETIFPKHISNNYTFTVKTLQIFGVMNVTGTWSNGLIEVDFVKYKVIVTASSVTGSKLSCNGGTNTKVTAYVPVTCRIGSLSLFGSGGLFIPRLLLSQNIYIDDEPCDASLCSITTLQPEAGDVFTFTVTILQSFVMATVSDSISNATITTEPSSRAVSFLLVSNPDITLPLSDRLSHAASTSTTADTPMTIEDSSGAEIKEKIVSISCHPSYCIACTFTGKLLSWGEDIPEALGRSSGGSRVGQITVGANDLDLTRFKFIQVAALKHCYIETNDPEPPENNNIVNIALTSEGYIYTWGTGITVPRRLSPPNVQFDRIAEEGYFFIASTASGDVYTWGRAFEAECLGRSGSVAMAVIPDKLQFNDPVRAPFTRLISGPTYGILLERDWDMFDGIKRYSVPRFWVWEWDTGKATGYLQHAKFLSTTYSLKPVLSYSVGLFNQKDEFHSTIVKRVISYGGNLHGLYFLLRDEIEEEVLDTLYTIPFEQCDTPPCFSQIQIEGNITALSVGPDFALAADGGGKIWRFTNNFDSEPIKDISLLSGQYPIIGTVSLLYNDYISVAVIDPPITRVDPLCTSTEVSRFCRPTLQSSLTAYSMAGTQYVLSRIVYSESHLSMIARDMMIRCLDNDSPNPPECVIDCSNKQCFKSYSTGTGWVLRGLTIQNGNASSGNGGMVSLVDSTRLSLDSVKIINCSAFQGGAIASTGGTISLKGVSIIGSKATSKGGAIIMTTTSQSVIRTLRLSGSSIYGNTAIDGAGLHLKNTKLILIDSSVIANSASGNGGGLNGERLTVSSRTSLVSENKALRGGGIFVRDAALTIDQTVISNNSGSLLAGGIYIEFSTLLLTNSALSGNVVEKGTGGGIYAQGNRTLIIRKSQFESNSALKGDGGGGLFLYCAPDFSNSTFSYNTAVRGGALAIRSESSLILKECGFRENEAYEGGGALSFLEASQKILILLENVNFTSNRVCPSMASLVCPRDINTTLPFLPQNGSYPKAWQISEVNFRKYIITRGGAIEIYGSPLISYTNVFGNNNYAAAGGFWFWDPTINRNYPFNEEMPYPDIASLGNGSNWAIHGANYATPPLSLQWIERINETASGFGFQEPVSVGLFDAFGQPVATDWLTTASAEAGPDPLPCISTDNVTCVPTVVIGTGRVHRLEMGKWRFAPITENAASGYIGIQKKPNVYSSLLVRGFYESSKIVRRSRVLITPPLNILMRECAAGEYDDLTKCIQCQTGEFSNETGVSSCLKCPLGTHMNSTAATACLLCEPGTYMPEGLAAVDCLTCSCCFTYAHYWGSRECKVCIDNSASMKEDLTQCFCDPGYYRVPLSESEIEGTDFMQQYECVSCPEGANCSLRGTTIENVKPEEGWFAELGDSNTHFYKCYVELACLNADREHPCYPGYTGHLCQQCIPGMGRESGNKCVECPTLNPLMLAGAFLIVGLFILWTIYINITSATTQKQYSILIKVLISAAQFNMLALGFNFEWPSELVSILSFQQSSMDTDSLYNLDCLVQGTGIPSFFFQGVVYLITIGCFFILPLIIFFIWAQIRYSYLTPSEIRREHDTSSLRRYLYHPFTKYYTAVLIISCFTFHPTITSYTLSMFSCQELNHLTREEYLQADLSVMCWTDYHVKWLLAIALPFFVFIVGVPVSVGLFMWRARNIIVTGQSRRGREEADWKEDMALRIATRDDFIRKKLEKQAVATSSAQEDIKINYSSPEYLLSDEDKSTDAWKTDINKQELEEIDVARYSYSFLYKGYERRVFGWEMVVISRKIALSIITVFFAYEVNFQVIWSLVLVMGCILIHAYEQPFVSKAIDRTELYSLCNSFMTFFLGQFLVPDRDVSFWVRALSTYLIVISNIVFLIFIIGQILKHYLKPTEDKGIMTALAIREDELPELINLEKQFLSNLNHAIGLRPEDERITILRTQFPQQGNRRLRIFHIKILPPADDMAEQMTSFEAFEKLCFLFNARDTEQGHCLWMGLVTRHLDPDLVNPSHFFLKHPTETLWQSINSKFWMFVDWIVWFFTCKWTREEVEAKRRIGDDEDQIDIEMPALYFTLPRNYIELANALEPPNEALNNINEVQTEKPQLSLSSTDREKYESKLKAADDVAKFKDDLIDYWR